MGGRIRAYVASFKRELTVYRRVMRDPRCPRTAKFFLWAAVAYTLSPIDIIPDFIPVLGHLDDIVIVPVLVWLGVRALPVGLVEEIRQQVVQEAKNVRQ